MVKRKRKQSHAGDKNKTPSWRTMKNDEPRAIFDPSAASLRKNKEYLELKRDIALKGNIIIRIELYYMMVHYNKNTHRHISYLKKLIMF